MENRCIPIIKLVFKELPLKNHDIVFHQLICFLSDVCFFFMVLFCIRIRALYAQILEKDAVIKILNQRLHQDQGRKDEQSPRTNLLNMAGAPLRPASSTPSISTIMSTTRSRGEELLPFLIINLVGIKAKRPTVLLTLHAQYIPFKYTSLDLVQAAKNCKIFL